MGSAWEDGVADPQPHPEDAGGDAGGSFDPGLDTGYLRRAPREHELSPEPGAAPFDPGPGRYDERRARTQEKRRQRLEAQRLKPSRDPGAPAPRVAEVIPIRPRIDPAVKGPVRKRVRAAENRRRVVARRRGLFWPTAKAGLAVSVVIALSGALGSVLGLPMPGLNETAGNESFANSASIFGIDPGTPAGLVKGYVFPILGPHDLGERDARFGAQRYGHMHEGQDVFGKVGTPELAVHDGIVVDRGRVNGRYSGGRGNYLAIYSPDDNHSFVYMHMVRPPVAQLGDKVHGGQLLGRLGCTGSCEGPHLHFEVRIGKATLRSQTKAVDPLPFLRQWPEATPG